jgi:putative transposase
VFSRKIVGLEIHAEQTGEHAAALFRKAHLREGVADGELVLHSDNGSPMKGATLLVTLQRLGVVPPSGRPEGETTTPTRRRCSRPANTAPDSPASRSQA